MLVNCPESLSDFNQSWKVFLAGPIQGASDWQHNLPDLENVVWLSPRKPSYPVTNFNYTEQVQWETDALRMANIVIFWIPKPAEEVGGRSYAQTTRFELGENLARGKRIILGAYNEFPGRKYLEFKASKYSNVIDNKVYNSLEDCLGVLENYINTATPTVYFTSDTHFSSDRTLELSKRPFETTEEMDWTMIERWNNKVNPIDTVWHLGDFGEAWPLQFLSGKVKLVTGNYERDGKDKPDVYRLNGIYKDGITEITIGNEKYLLTHEPTRGQEEGKDAFCLFGHIHGRQKIKSWGGLDVGVDCNNYEPISIDDVKFYKNAIEKGYYDQEVFC